jgi:hypothetical protein
MSPNILDANYKPEAMTAAESARFHACACDPARRRHNPAPDQGVMFGQLGLLDVIAESGANPEPLTPNPARILRLGFTRQSFSDGGPVARQVIDIPELRGALDDLAPGDDMSCALCGRMYPVAQVVPSGYCPDCDARHPLGHRHIPPGW